MMQQYERRLIAALQASPDVAPTRGGLATVCAEMQRTTAMGIRLSQPAIPVRDPVQSVCDMLGYDPLYLACEGRVVAVIDPAFSETLLARWRDMDAGKQASLIGHVDARVQHVLLETELGGERILEELEDDPLPRIC